MKRILSSEEPKQIVSEESSKPLLQSDITLPSIDTHLELITLEMNDEQSAHLPPLNEPVNESVPHIAKKLKTASLDSASQENENKLSSSEIKEQDSKQNPDSITILTKSCSAPQAILNTNSMGSQNHITQQDSKLSNQSLGILRNRDLMIGDVFLRPEEPGSLALMAMKSITRSGQFSSNDNKKESGLNKDQLQCSAEDKKEYSDILGKLGLSGYIFRILSKSYFKKAVKCLEKYVDVFRKGGFEDKMIIDIIIRCASPNRGFKGLELLAEEDTRVFLKQLGFTHDDMTKCLIKSFGTAKIIERILNNKKDLLELRKENKISVEKIINLVQEDKLENYIKTHKRVTEKVALNPQLGNNNIAAAFFNQASDLSNINTNLTAHK